MENQNPTSNPSPQPQPTAPVQPVPTLTPDAGAALLAELKKLTAGMDANRQAIEAGFERLADELNAELDEDDEPGTPPETILLTPAATARNERRSNPDASDVERTTSGLPRKQDDESDDDFLDRLRNLPPIGSPRRQWMEPRKLFEARRYDGTPSD